MKLIFKKLFPAIFIHYSRLAIWFILIFSAFSFNASATDYTITVTHSGSSSYIFVNGGLNLGNNPDISVNVGDKITFDVSSSSAAHPFAIVSALNASNGYSASNKVSTGVTNNGEPAVATVVWDLTGATPGVYYYVCTLHPAMRGKITVNSVGVDSDGDGVNDDIDVDDDNDGILDVIEGDIDTDGDGTVNRLDLDSDGDNCFDVIESGYGDLDNPSDGKVGTEPTEYTEDGKVKNVTYKLESEIDDLDGNGTKDYLEKGSDLSKVSDPASVNVLEYSNVTFTATGSTVNDLGTITYSWQITTDPPTSNNVTWKNISTYQSENANHPGKYSDLDKTTMKIDSVTATMTGFRYRLLMQTLAFKCDQDVTSSAAQLTVFKTDTDGDNVPDDTDLDDDNDGITDVTEGGDDLDTDGDGIPNRIDPDSDGDGCNDVNEAGLSTDENNDGKVGIPTVLVNANGLVTSTGSGSYSYDLPADLDGNGTYDFLESASPASVVSSPTDVSTASHGDAIFVAKGSSDGVLKYTWQVSTDAGNTFTDIEVFDNKGEQSEIMIVGGGNPVFDDNYRSFLEFYANTDIPANKYKVRLIAQDGAFVENTINTSLSAGQYFVAGQNNNGWVNFFGGNINTVYGVGTFKYARWSNISNYYFDHRIEIRRISDDAIVDVYGEDTNENGTDEAHPWVTPEGFFKRKDNRYATNEFNLNDWTLCSGCLDKTTNAKSSTPYPYKQVVLPATSVYTGHDDDTLKINAAPRNFDRYQYRAIIRTVNYACDVGSETDPAELVVFLDTDGDGVGDVNDLDDDNDGILDTEEGTLTDDFDGDGIPNRLDSDSDGDGCSDVIEAGFTDSDGDGILGAGVPTVGTDGKITGHSYSDPQDLNSNLVDDFLESGYEAGIYSHPVSVFLDEEEDTIFVSQATVQTQFTLFFNNEPNSTTANHASMNSNALRNRGWFDNLKTNTYRFVVEFDSLTNGTIAGYTYMFQHRGHSYYVSNNTSNFDTSVSNAQSIGGYLVVINDHYEAELVREEVRKIYSNTNFWINHFLDTKSPGYDGTLTGFNATGWVSGYIPNSEITHQWEVGVISGNDTTWTNVTDGTNYTGATNDTLRVKSAPANFDKNLYRMKATPTVYACSAGPAYSLPAQLTVSSDPDNDGIKNSVDLDDDNDGILDTEEGGKDLDTDGDGIPNRLDLDSDDDGCLDAQEAGFSGYDSEGRLCANANCAGTDGKVTGHGYGTPADGDNSGVSDYLEKGFSPTISSDLPTTSIGANNSSTSLVVSTTIDGIPNSSSYFNWNGGEPNNSGNYMHMYISNGRWDDVSNSYNWIVVEFNKTRNDAISGFTKLMDDYNGHSYYVSDNYQRYWTTAKTTAEGIGGYLTVIGDAAENQLIHEAVRAKKGTSRNIWIGHYQDTSSPDYSEPVGGWTVVDYPSTVGYTWQVSSDSTNWTTINAENDTVTFTSGSGSGVNLFTNGSLDGTVKCCVAPTGWTRLASDITSDINNLENEAVGGTYYIPDGVNVSNSNDGGTWVGFHDRTDMSYEEGIYQNVSLEAGETYTISYEQANFGACNSSDCNNFKLNNSGKIRVFIDAGTNAPTTLIGDGGEMVHGTGWNNASVNYTAPTTGNYSIGFVVQTTPTSSGSTGAYLSIDGISIKEAVSSTTTTTAYTGYGTNSLTINPVFDDLNGYQYRVIASNPGFACAVADTSAVTTLLVRDDFDLDGIRDEIDVDDDNDGILDTQEGNGVTDTDGDGNPDSKDLDSDNDGCYDVDEAYGTSTDRDPNNDGVYGDANPTINSNGSVSGASGTTGLDQDGNGVKDFQEAGAAITSMSCPDDITATEGSNVEIITIASGQGETSVNYEWQVSADTGKTWSDVNDESSSEIIISGIGYGKTSTSNDGYPKFIEIYALKDADLRNYRMRDNITNGNTYNYSWVMREENIQMKKGEYLLIYYPSDKSTANTFFGSDIDNLYDHTVYEDYFYTTMRDGNDSYALEKNINNTWTYVDRVGNGTASTVLNYDDGWLYRKQGSKPTPNYSDSDWTQCKDCLESSTNAGATTPFPVKTFTTSVIDYDFSKGDSLVVTNVPASANGYQFRAIGSTPSYVCGDNDTTCAVTITVVGDNDRDGIPDDTDIDDDNDGILDSVEGEDTDTDGDGIVDKFDLDSDGDGCLDVVEAGFTDPDGDGILGTGTPEVESDGGVKDHNFDTPLDEDGNGTADYLEVGSTVTIVNYSNYFLSEGSDTATFNVNYNASGATKLHWQVSKDNANTWTDIDAGDNGTGSTGATDVCTTSDWGNGPWTWTGGNLEGTFKDIMQGTSTDATIKITENTDVVWDTGYPKIENSAFGGVQTLGLSLDPKSGSGNSEVTTTITFTNPVSGLRILLTDIDSKTAGWKDKIVVTSDVGNPTADSLNANPTFSISGNTLTAKDNSESAADNKGTARLTFPDGVSTVTIKYSDVSGILDPDSRGIGINFEGICVNTGSASYGGVYESTLNIYDVTQGMDEWRYRLRITTPGYACHDTTYTPPARLDVDVDNDNDGILNNVDLDDDNDGILDTDEGEGDLDGDGIRNRFDLDSDGDGCLDVTEAGFTDKIIDTNDDGILGDDLPYTVDSLGRITSGQAGDGYTTPVDQDGNGSKDFLQFGQNVLNAILNQSNLTMLSSGTGNFKITASVPSGDQISYQWQESRDDGASWFNVPEQAPYSGTNTNELILTQPSAELSGYRYRVVLTIASYKCGVAPLNLEATLTVYPDNDKDGVRDSDDQDDDNDGILDTYEGTGDQDNDQDGIPNRFDPDSDGDGCLDVEEAGYLDANADGLLGPDSVVTMFIDSLNSLGVLSISANGRVNSFGGYGVPNDLDNNGIYDFLEEGAPITALECPDAVTVAEGGNGVFNALATVEAGNVDYQWEITKDTGKTWKDISESGLMFVGLGYSYRSSSYTGTPKFIELVATTDIEDLSRYRIYGYQNGNTSSGYNYNSLSGSVKKGQKILLYYDYWQFYYFFNTYPTTASGYAKVFDVGNTLRYGMQGGNDVFEIVHRDADGNSSWNGNTDVVDVVGVRGEDGTGKDWEYSRGWLKRKNNKLSSKSFKIGDWTACNDCFGTASTNSASSTPYALNAYSTTQSENGSTTASLTLKNLSYDEYHGAQVRVKVSTPAFSCGEGDTSCVATISIIPYDTDEDGVPDREDADDDNDGILDVDEGGEDLDTDGDGVPNRIDDDSDGDGCLDVLEAGFEDGDQDGVIGSGTPSVDASGKVEGHEYDTPLDTDSDGTKDFLQVSSQAEITSHPIDIVRQGGDDGQFSVTVTGDASITYQWQFSDDDTLTWTDLEDGTYYSGVNTNTLSLTAVTEDIDGYYYRIKVVTPALVCADPVYSNAGKLTAKDDSDGDGIDNAFDLDSDNDGILNTEEKAPDNLDTDGDGTPDYLDLDSDGDGCYDVVEAGYDDPDGDGRPGTGDPVIIAGIGMVDGHPYGVTDGYDSDDNGVYDFQEAGGPLTSITNPSNVVSSDGKSETFTTSGTAISPIAYQWQVSEDNGDSWADIKDEGAFSGSNNAILTIDPISTTMNSNLFRAILSTPGFSCGENDTTLNARLIALPDNDGDGIQDLFDEDDDNDGILDVDEFIDDLDGDGIPNSFDLDSDDDGCDDVIEAGFLDPDGDGILGDSVDTNGDGKKDKAATVDSKGRVTSGTGYTTPDDLDGNGVKDYLESGSQVVIDVQPNNNNNVSEFSDMELTVEASSDGMINYQWQISDDCETWTDLNESPALMITGLFETKNRAYYGVELYALRDIDNLSNYGITTSAGTSGSSPGYTLSNTDLKQGQYFMLYYNSSWTNFFSNEASTAYKSQSVYGTYDMVRYNRFNITLYEKNTSNQWDKVDVYGDHSVSADGSAWDVEEGWAYRKNGRGASLTYNADDWNIKKKEFSLIGGTSANGNDIVQDAYPLFRFSGPSEFKGVKNDTLQILRTPLSYNDKNFRVVLTTPGFKCDTTVFSVCANLKVDAMSDTDGDGVPDYVDLDSDNDGIPDLFEGCDIDTDGDGLPNCLDLDSDGDGCDDVLEAGFTDENGDGYLGPQDVFVDVNGLVTSGIDGYSDPSDLDNNGVNDYLEAGDTVNITLNPATVNVLLLDDTIMVGSGSSPSVITQRWQQSDDGGSTFRTLQNTPSLIITGVMEANRSSQRPKLIEFKALRDVDCLRDYKVKFGNAEYVLGNTTSSCVTLTKGEFYYIVYTSGDAISFLAGSGSNNNFNLNNYKYHQVNNLNTQLTGKNNVTLEYAPEGYASSKWVEVDKVEGSETDGYNKGWRYKKDTTQVSNNFRAQDWTTCDECLNNEFTNLSAGSGPDDYKVLDNGDTLFYSFPVASFGTSVVMSGVNTDTLRIENIPFSMNGYLFNLELQTSGFSCAPIVSTDISTLNVFLPDYDNDGYVDKLDLDADNDGILDVDEDTTDIDGDGFPNYIDLDSDGDGCFDAVEAGFTDPDNDGYLGTSPVSVDNQGRVINQGGYSTPSALDLDGNGVMDYKEVGSQVEIVRQPNNQIYYEEKVKFFVEASSDAVIGYQWQILLDTTGESWTDLSNVEDFSTVTTDTLNVDNITDYVANKFRVMLTTPAFACGDTVYSVPVMIINSEDWDEDGIPDNIDIDDDNDGIIDISEGEDVDTDGDGIPNSKDNDSDGDGCVDAVEAGYEDGDDDGFLGTSPFEVTSVGTVIGHGGYQPPEDDIDENGVLDLLEFGSDAVANTVPVNDTIIAGQNASFTASFTADGAITYQWEYSADGSNWNSVVDTLVIGQDTSYFSGKTDTTLNITNVTFAMGDYQYRLVASTPSFKCGPDTPSAVVSAILAGDNDQDGIIDIIDLDDDNDGILDSVETGIDTDGDGIPDWFDLDSDNDGCLDVEEAGFEDLDGDGLLCTSPVVVDDLGKVVCLDDSSCDDDPYTNMSWKTGQNAGYVADSEKTPGYYRLTNASTYNYGSVFRQGSPNNGRVDLRGDFVIKADLYLGDKDGNGGSGIAFNITQNNNQYSLYYWGQMAMQFNNALSVEFDTRDDGSYDPEADHSSLHINGNNIAGTSTLGVTTTSGYGYNYHSQRPIITETLENIEDGQWREFVFSWNASTKTVTVEFDGKVLMTYQVDIVKDVLSGSNLAYFGFTSDNYNYAQEQRVYIKSICEIDASSGESIYKGYKEPNDLDDNGMYDFKQAGDVPEFSDSYEDDDIVIVKEGSDTTFTTSVTYDGTGDVVWQMCNDDCSECTIIEKSPGLMMTGIFRGDIGGIEPSVIEFYALEDIADLSIYGIEIARDGAASDGEEYSLSAVSLDSGKFYTVSSNDLYYKSWFGDNPSQQSLYNNFDGDDAIVLYKNDSIVDVFGTPGKDGSGELWDYTLGWAYRKDGRIYSSTFNVNDWKTCRGCSLGSSFNTEMDNPFPVGGFAGAPTFEDVDSDNLTLKNATPTLDGVRIRRAVIDPAYACSPESGGDCIRVAIFLDNDKDGIIDEIDLDDDNDGILDSLETDEDTDGDGIPNHFDLDSDGDGCLDAVEAGFTDGDDDGLLGNSPVTVDTLGLVTSGSDGYTLPADNDNSGTFDFLEFGTVAVLVSSPDTVSGTQGSAVYFVAKGTAVGGAMNSYPFNYYDWVTQDNATWQTSYFYLTSTSYRDGQLWNKKKIHIDRDFVVSSKINFGSYGSNGGEGVAFVLQPNGTSAYGSNYANLGYRGGNISNAIAVEFDTHGQTEDFVAIVSLKNGARTVLSTKNVSELEDNTYKNISVSWDADANKLAVSIGGIEIVSATSDIVSEVFGMSQVNFGFTASTGNYWNSQSVKDISVSGTLEGDESGNVVFDWQVSSDSATTWKDITSADSLTYSGIKNDTLYIPKPPKDINGYMYRTTVRNPAFACDPGVLSAPALLEILPDNDADGIPDDIDVDDDNDGILDTKEDTTDLDGDGIPNHFDLDSDGDGCADVIEAGFDDNDTLPDGILGNSPVKVDELGRVIQSADGTTSQGYFKPKDGDANGVEDYREVGSAAFIISEPVLDKVEVGDTIVIGTVVDVTGSAEYEWYVSIDSGNSWILLPPFAPYSGVDTDTLTILGAPVSMNNYQYKMIVSTPAYACGDNDTTSVIPIRVTNDYDEDGIPNDIDIDDDNDGIVDTLEVIDSENDDDYDNDGIPNHYDLDSDGDGCFDVLEAGFSDPDGDGILCTSPVIVNNIGQVIGCASLACNSIDDEDYNLVGDAEKWTDDGDNEVYRLTRATTTQSGSVWSKEKINLTEDFKVEGKLNLGSNPSGADGIAFVIQPLASDLGGEGGGLGYAGISPSVAVEFDTYNNSFSGTASNHAAVIFDGVPYGTHTNLHIFSPGIEDGLYHDFVFNWTAETKTMTVSWDGTEIITLTKDIVADIFSGDAEVYYGFTAATGSATNNQLVWLENVCVPVPGSDVPKDGYTEPNDSDGSGVVDFKEVDNFDISITTQPISIQIPDKTTGYLFVEADVQDSASYQWQKSDDGSSWSNVTDTTFYLDRGEGIFDTLMYIGSFTDTLFISGADTIIDSTYYRVIVDIPTSACAIPSTSNSALVTVITDIDLDNDGIPNVDEGYGDLDGDGIPNYLDLDSDNDGIPDVIEGGDGALDTNGDGMIDENDDGFADEDEDGMADDSEDTPEPDTDGDGTPDFLDIDSDNDGIFDVVEGGDGDLDTNGDGMIDDNDDGFSDEDNDGMDDDSEDTPQPDYDGDGNPDYLDIDSDNDGIFDVEEGGSGDLDTNNDGVIDSNDDGFSDVDGDGMDDDSELIPAPDSDGDGNPDYLDIDSDNDGIFDVEEGGDGDLDTNNDGVIDTNDTGYTDLDGDGMDDSSEPTTVPDNDGDGKPNYLDIDSDNDGIFDVDEGGDGGLDTNNDGVIDTNDTGYSDVDADGMDDDAESTPVVHTDGDQLGDGIPDYLDIDSDNDGIFDVVEGGDGDLDTNNDGVIDTNDTGFVDADDDGMDDTAETTLVTNSDFDLIPDYQDIDSDNDGIFDVEEGGDGDLDTNNDGVIDSNDTGYTDLDADGMDDTAELTSELDSDSDGVPNYLDIDSDDDGIHDVIEGGDGNLDTNGDGAIDPNDDGYVDSDGDGMDDDSESTPVVHTDGDQLGDGIPDYIDIDSDNDGIFDVEEGGDGDLDTNDDGVINSGDTGFTDTDGDGMDDDAESTPVTNSDNDLVPDFQDIDSDNDGIFDVVEGGDSDLDVDGDGVIGCICSQDNGYFDLDGNGMNDTAELTPETDSDSDGVPDYIDIDSDNDGIHDVTESGDGNLDTNGDGAIDSNDSDYSDSDGDGMDDDSEPTDVLDSDGDSLPNHLDIDSDNDGIYDVEEGGDSSLDTNDDGVINDSDTGYSDSDNDGMDDDSETTPVTNTDNDGNPDFVDIDSDNDGIQDVIEGGDGVFDTNGDGMIDTLDNDVNFTFVDADGDGMADQTEDTPVIDSDGDGANDYQDLDSDNDGIFDVVEGGDGIDADFDEDGTNEFTDLDTNDDGMIDSDDVGYVDADNDGMADGSEGTGQPNSDVTEDLDDGIPNYLDLDSDDDGCNDVVEAGFADLDGDGILGVGLPEIDDNGLVVTDEEEGYVLPVDSDNNGVLDCYDALILVVNITSQPQDAGTVFQGDNVSYSVGVTVDGDLPAEYQWQMGVVSDDEQDTTWTDLANGLQFSGIDTDSMTITDVTFDEFDNTLYRVKVTATGYRCAFVLSEAMVLDVKFRDLHIPEGFSPNSDGTNDNWVITGIDYYPNSVVQIYNRWELKVFEMEGYKNDDPQKYFEGIANFGNTNGKLLPETVYFFVIDLGDTDIDGNAVEEDNRYRKGIVYIRRGNE